MSPARATSSSDALSPACLALRLALVGIPGVPPLSNIVLPAATGVHRAIDARRVASPFEWPTSRNARRRPITRAPPDVIVALSVLRAATAATAIAESAAGQQQNDEDDEQDHEHGSPPESQLVGLAHTCLYRLFWLRPVRLSVTMSTAFFAEPLAWSTRPSFFRRLFAVSAPAASFTRPFALSMFLWVISPPEWDRSRVLEWQRAVGAAVSVYAARRLRSSSRAAIAWRCA